MENEELVYLNQLEQELQEQNRVNKQLHNAQMSLYGNVDNENLIVYQLDIKSELDYIYHLLRGDIIKEDEHGNRRFVEAEEEDSKPFNEFGTQIIMNILSFYLSKNTLLSNYEIEEINDKILDLGIDLSDLIFNRYEEMMMTTTFEHEFEELFGTKLIELSNGKLCVELESGNKTQLFYVSSYMIERTNEKINEHLMGKMKMYPIIVRELMDSVHSAYLRALGGEERESLRTARTVTQSAILGQRQNYPVVSQQRKRKLSNLFGLMGGG